ncbi:DVU_1556 family methyltransferase [Desulfocurvus sp. DL9XJH121]
MAEAYRQQPLWERPELRAACGDTLRPGGLELTDRAARLAGMAPGWRVLDAGAGLGATVEHLRRAHGARAVGLEPSARQLARSGAHGALVRGDAQRPPFVDAGFQMVFCECVLSLLPDKARALAGMARVLAPGGWLALSDLYSRPGRACAPATGGSCADGAPAEAELLDLVRGAGFAVRVFEDHTKRLKELAARLIFAGVPAGCRGPGNGYCLLMAQRPEA